jgi:hypothetical protein
MPINIEKIKMQIIPLLYDYIFPNFIVPNASPIESTIINYIYTQFNRGSGPDAFLETHLETDKSPLKMIFGDQLYDTWPSSLMHGGTRLKNDCYKGLLKYEEHSVYHGKVKYNRYIYPIKMGPHFNTFIGATHKGSKQIGEYFWKNMSAEALHDAQTGKCIVFLDWGEENYISKVEFDLLHRSIMGSQIPKENIVLAHNSFNTKEIYESWFTEGERHLTVMNWPYSLYYNSWHYTVKPHICMDIELFKSTRDTIRPNHFLFRTRRARGHRIALLSLLATDNLLDKGDWSFLDSMSFEHFKHVAKFDYHCEIDDAKVEAMFNTFPHRLQSETDSNFNNIGGWSDLSPVHSTSSYFDITTETYTVGEHKSLTEKICKPLVNFQPFVFSAFPGVLQLLREHGFKTFSPWIDESYDLEQDDVKRLHMIYNEVKRLSSMSKEEIHKWYWEMEDILIHNHNRFLDFHKTDTVNKSLIDYLTSRLQ